MVFVGVGLGVGVRSGVLDGPGVPVGMKVGGAVTLNPILAVAGSRVGFPANFAIIALKTGTVGVSVHEALPLALVVAKQELPSSVNWTLAPLTGWAGVTETSLNDPTTVTGLPLRVLPGLRLRLRKLVWGPEVQVITDRLDVMLAVPSLAVAVIMSMPGKIPA